MDKYAETKQIINDMASVKMAMNSHKLAIEDHESMKLLKMLQEEVNELYEAVAENSEDLVHIIEEAADVQNFLVALVHQAVIKYRTRKQ